MARWLMARVPTEIHIASGAAKLLEPIFERLSDVGKSLISLFSSANHSSPEVSSKLPAKRRKKSK